MDAEVEARSHLRCVLSFPTLAASPGCWQSLQAALHGVNVKKKEILPLAIACCCCCG